MTLTENTLVTSGRVSVRCPCPPGCPRGHEGFARITGRITKINSLNQTVTFELNRGDPHDGNRLFTFLDVDQ
jgi:hypothetical protein